MPAAIAIVKAIYSSTLRRSCIILLLLIPVAITAQEHQEIGFMAGVANYYGDLQSEFFPDYGYKPMAGIIYKYFMNPYVGIRTGASYTNLTAADSLSGNSANKARNLSFSTHLIELHGALEINFLPVSISKRHLSPYIFGGISLFYYNPYARDPMGNLVELRPLSTEGEGLPTYPDRKQYSVVNMAFPFGGGMKCLVANRIMLGVEMGLRYTNTDYLDDVSKSYVNLNTLQAYKGPLAAVMSYRGNTVPGWNGSSPNYGDPRGDAGSNDWYWYGNITVTFYIQKRGMPENALKTDCPILFK